MEGLGLRENVAPQRRVLVGFGLGLGFRGWVEQDRVSGCRKKVQGFRD